MFTAKAISKGRRSGTIPTADRLLNVTLGNPLEQGAEKRGPSPELWFAGAQFAEGKQDELLGRIQKRTGETREVVEKAIKESGSTCGCR